MSRLPSAGERLGELDDLERSPGWSVLDAAVRSGQRRRRRRTRASAAAVAAALVAAALVRHSTTGDPSARPAPLTAPATSASSGPLPADVQRQQDAVQDALAAAAPHLPALDWAAARTSTQRARRPSASGTGERVLVDLSRSAGFTGGDPGDAAGDPPPGVSYRTTTPLLRSFPTDPCRVAGALPVPAAGGGSGAPRCTLHTGLPGGPGGSASVAGASGVVARWEWQRVVGTSLRAGSAVGSVVQTVRQAVLVSGGTTWSLAASSVGDAGGGARPALDLDQLELGVRYLATAAIEGGPGLSTARLVSRAVLARELPAVAPGPRSPDWSSPGADSAGAAPPGPDGRRLLDLLETTDLDGRARLGYRVVRAAGPAPQDPCAAAGVVGRERGSSCRSERRADGARTAVLDRPGARQVTVVAGAPGEAGTATGAATGTGGVGRWVAVAITGPVLPLDAGQLERLALALAATDRP